MSNRFNTAAAALALTLAALVPASAAEATSTDAVQAFAAPAVISVGYGNPRVATSAAGAFRQGGFAVAGAVRWVEAREPAASVATFNAPGVISVAYTDRRTASNAGEVLRQGGFKVAGAVRWLAAEPVAAEAMSEGIRVGAL